MPFGLALTARVLAPDGPRAMAFVNWFKKLFLEA
jgi:hypothetical protein